MLFFIDCLSGITTVVMNKNCNLCVHSKQQYISKIHVAISLKKSRQNYLEFGIHTSNCYFTKKAKTTSLISIVLPKCMHVLSAVIETGLTRDAAQCTNQLQSINQL